MKPRTIALTTAAALTVIAITSGILAIVLHWPWPVHIYNLVAFAIAVGLAAYNTDPHPTAKVPPANTNLEGPS